jgi:hypothetical protein
VAAPDFYSVAPDCIHHGLPPGIPFSPEIMKPYEDCTGFFTFGPGREWAFGNAVYPIPEGGHVGDVLFKGTAGIYALTAIGFVVSILFIIAWVWFEHRKLMDRAATLRAAGTPPIGGPPAG